MWPYHSHELATMIVNHNSSSLAYYILKKIKTKDAVMFLINKIQFFIMHHTELPPNFLLFKYIF